MSKFRAPLLSIFFSSKFSNAGRFKKKGPGFFERPGARRAPRGGLANAPPSNPPPTRRRPTPRPAPRERILQLSGRPRGGSTAEVHLLGRTCCWIAAGSPGANGDYVPVIWPGVGACRERYNRCRSFLNRALSGHGCYAPPLNMPHGGGEIEMGH